MIGNKIFGFFSVSLLFIMTLGLLDPIAAGNDENSRDSHIIVYFKRSFATFVFFIPNTNIGRGGILRKLKGGECQRSRCLSLID